MKKMILYVMLLAILVSCNRILFLEPLPKGVQNEYEFPEVMQGAYLVAGNDDTMHINKNSSSYTDLDFGWKEWKLSDSSFLRYYKDMYLFNTESYLHSIRCWEIYIIEILNNGQLIKVYSFESEDSLKLSKLLNTTPLIESDTGFFDEYLVNPTRKQFKKIVKDSLFVEVGRLIKIE